MSHLWRLRTWRRQLFEALGSDRFSKPAYAHIDDKLARHLPRPGFFVEAGALDGVYESNTYYLERFLGWSGILIEPSPRMFARLAVNRPNAHAFHCALVSSTYESETIALRDDHVYARIADRSNAWSNARETAPVVAVPARTLDAVLKEAQAPRIDLLSLDVEGYEAEVLAGFDVRRHRPRYILLEQMEHPTNAVSQLIAAEYELVDALSSRDYLYRAR